MLIRDLPTGATFRRGLHTYRIIGETYDRPQDSDVHGVGSSDARRDVVRTDGRGGILHVPVLWTAHRDPGRHADPGQPIDDTRHKLSTFDPARVPVGGTVRGLHPAISGWRPVLTVRKTPTPTGSLRVRSRSRNQWVIAPHLTERDPGRHRGSDDTRPGPDPALAREAAAGDWSAVPSIPVSDGTPYRLEDHATGEVLERGTIIGGEAVADGVTRGADEQPFPELPYAGPWTPDGHGNVRVPAPLVRALLSDLRSIESVIYENSDPLALAQWPAAREFILGAREV